MAKKKSFIDAARTRENTNPAMAFISKESVEAVDGNKPAAASSFSTGNEKPSGYKNNPQFIETKTKRVQLVMQPSLYDRIKAASSEAGLSVNEYCHRVLDLATKESEG